MKKIIPSLLITSLLMLAACTFVPKLGMKESRWIRNTISHDLIYIEGDVKAYRSDGAYYYFRNGTLVMVGQTLQPAHLVGTAN